MLPGNQTEDNRIDELEIAIRPATKADVPAITAIFNHAIAHTTASFYRNPRTVEQRTAWLTNRAERYSVWVADSASGVVGWVAMDPWSEKHGYRITCEVSYYVHPDFHGRGIGSRLLEQIIEVARQNDFRNLLAKICENNIVSLDVAKRFGFECVGTLRSVGEKFGELYDVHFYQKKL